MVKRIHEPLGSQKRAEVVRFCERRIPFTLFNTVRMRHSADTQREYL